MDSTTVASPASIDVYEMVTNRIIELLEAGTIPWQKPWTDAGTPRNLLSKRPYRGINVWLLLSLNYEHNLFLTWDQLKAIGGSVNKNEKGHIVVFWKISKKKPEELDEKGNPKTVSMLRYYKVFNIAQCRDIRPDLLPSTQPDLQQFVPLEVCEGIIKEMPDSPVIVHNEQRAYYQPVGDLINMPRKKSFKLPESYYSTLFHELVHSTGHEKRLNRKTLTDMVPFGSPGYSMEELVAEMGSAFLCSVASILPNQIDNAAAYLNNWLGVLKKDKRFIIQTSGQAQKAANYILNRLEEDTKEEIEEVTEESVVR